MSIDSFSERRERRLSPSSTIDSDRIVPLSEGVLEADHDFQVRAVNFVAAELLGWDHPVSLTRDLNDQGTGLLTPELQREVQVALAVDGRWAGQAVLRRRDGSHLDAYLTACVLHGSSGSPAGIVATFRPLEAVAGVVSPASQGDLIGVTGLPGHFCLYFQPEVDVRTGEVTGTEALLRWWHPGLGVVSPGPALANRRWAPRLAEVEVWSVFAVCRQIAAWSAQGRPLGAGLNFSRRHLADPGLLSRVRQALTATGIDPSLLVVDLPSAALVHTPDRVRTVATELASLEVRVSIDDVTPAVPVRAFAGVPVSVVKIARPTRRAASHADDPAADAAAGLRTTLDLAQLLDATSVAKAVETDQELAMLRSLGCDRAFGHLFLPPVPPEDLARTIWGDAPLGSPAPQARIYRRSFTPTPWPRLAPPSVA